MTIGAVVLLAGFPLTRRRRAGTMPVVLGALLATGSALSYAVVALAGSGVPAGIPVTRAGFAGGALLPTPGALIGGLSVLAAVAGLYLRRMGDSNSRGVAPNPLSKRAP
jgi:DME family drug/metabolite transporter